VISFFTTHVSPRAAEQVANVLSSGFLSEGTLVRRFEEELERHLGIARAVALNSGTSALHLGLACGGIGPGDEVILPAQTFIASGLSILHAGARPVFADIRYGTGNLDPESVRRRITSRTRAIMPVHWGGEPCDLDEIRDLAEANGLWVIEDAAHALGARYKGKPIGSLSRFTVFSFQAIKHLTTGDGGLLACVDGADCAMARRRRWFGIDRGASPLSPLGEREYDAAEVGYKYHLNDYAAALGLANLPDLDGILARRRAIAARYRRELADVPGLRLLESPGDRESACWLFTFHVERRLDFIRALKDKDIPASVVHLGIHKNAVFGQKDADLPAQRRFDETQLSIPAHQHLTEDDVGRIIAAIRGGW
jgi:perosamine synthetase